MEEELVGVGVPDAWVTVRRAYLRLGTEPPPTWRTVLPDYSPNTTRQLMQSTGSGLTGYLALTGALSGAVEALTAAPLLLYPAKALIAWPLLYHYGGGVRHLYWDEYKYGIQVDKTSPLEVPAVTASSRGLLYGSIAASVLLAAVSL